MIDLKEKTKSSKIVFQGELLDVRKDSVALPNGETGTREWINHPGAVCCVPLLPDGNIALIRQYRYALKKEMIELPAGKLNEGEDPKKCARRELEEEIGYMVNKLTFLINIHPAIGFANEKIWLFLAEDLLRTQSSPDNDEFLELIPTRLEDALDLIWSGKITDVKTIIGLLSLHMRLAQKQ